MTQQGEAGASVHLSFDHLGLSVDSFGASVLVREGERGGGGLAVQVKAAGEGVHVGQAGGARADRPGWGGISGRAAAAPARWRGHSA